MTIRRTIITAATALTAVALLAGCSGSNVADPTKSPKPTHTASATPTATPTVAMAPALAPIPAPTSKDDALQSSTKAANAFYKVNAEALANPALGIHYLDNYIDTSGLSTKGTEAWNVANAIQTYAANKWRQTGNPTTFVPDMRLSYTATSTVNGAAVPNGSVVLLGCGNVSGRKVVADAGGKPVPSEYQQNGSFAGELDLYYIPQLKGWRVHYAGLVQQNNVSPTC